MPSEEELREQAKQRAREKAKQRLSSLNGGDLSRGLGTSDKANISTAGPKPLNKVPQKQQEIQNPTTPNVEEKKTKQKTNLGKIVVDKSTIEQMANTQSAGKVRTKRLVIISLSVVIAVIWAFIIVTKMIKPQEGEQPNGRIQLSGNASSVCTVLLNDEELTEWLIPDGLSPEAKYEKIKLDLKLGGTTDDLFNVTLRIEVYNDGTKVENFGEIDNQAGFDYDTNSKQYKKLVKGNQTLTLLSTITLNDVRTCPQLQGISSDNAEIKIYIEVNNA